MNIELAKSAGFCFGVSNAVKMAEEEAKKGIIYTLGPIIHNKHETDRLDRLGIKIIGDVSELPEGARVLIRSHGVSLAVENALKAKNAEIYDATCPFVKKIHNIASEYSQKGYTIIIVGNKNHPEVLGIAGRCKKSFVISPDSEAPDLSEFDRVCVVSQTTAKEKNYKKITNFIKNTCKDAVIFDTICKATQKRQEEAAEIASHSDTFIVIGDKNSSNTRSLAQVAADVCKNVYQIEDANGLKNVNAYGLIGITAGASAPDWIIKEVLKTMEETKRDELSFAEEVEKTLITLNTGDVVRGTVIDVTPTEVYVSLAYKADGVIPASQISDDPSVKPADKFKIGDEVEAFVYRVSDVEGTVGLSIKKLTSMRSWTNIEAAYEEKRDITGKVIETVHGGVIALWEGVRIFIPASLANDRYLSDLSVLVGQEVPIRIRDINRGRRKVIGSIKDILVEEKKKKQEEFWAKIDAGQTEFDGKVKTLTNFGAFVDLGGVDGLIHISELSWTHIKHPSEVLAVGDDVKVNIIDANRETGKISLGFRKKEDNPWEILKATKNEGDIIDVKIVRLTAFGAFAEIIPGIDGLIHISQIANKRIDKPSDVLKVGETVQVKIVSIDFENKKVSLSIRALLHVEEAPAEAPAAEEVAEEAPAEAPAAEEVAEEAPAEEPAVEEAHAEESAVEEVPAEEEPAAEAEEKTEE